MNKILSAGLLIAVFILASSFSTKLNPQRVYSKAQFQMKADELRTEYGANKSFLPDLELASLIALSHFPELKDTRIQFQYRNIRTTMATRPTMKSLLKEKSQRVYVIYVDEKIKNNHGILANKKVPFNALVGLIGHEYQHIVEYEGKTALQIANLGIKYCSKKFKRQFECNTDLALIGRGLGWQLKDWAAYAMLYSSASEKYKTYKKNNYLTPDEIFTLIFKDKHYEQSLSSSWNSQ